MNLERDKIPIQALKISDEMFGIRTVLPLYDKDRSSLFKILGDNKVNIFFSSSEITENNADIFCLVHASYGNEVQHLILNNRKLQSNCRFYSNVLLVTLYPHRSDIRMVMGVVSSLLSEKISLCALASSISTLSFVVDGSRLNQVLCLMKRMFHINDIHGHVNSVDIECKER